jgi:DNA-directed RNA polymerase subunit RPC12/RpoP
MKTLQGKKSAWIVQSIADVMAAIENDSNSGWCIKCGANADGIEPDASKYACADCGARQVYGAEQLMLMGLCHE